MITVLTTWQRTIKCNKCGWIGMNPREEPCPGQVKEIKKSGRVKWKSCGNWWGVYHLDKDMYEWAKKETTL